MNDVLVAKLVLTPLFIAVVTLAGRRFGPAVGGLLAGLPLTSGTVSLFLALEQGPAFAVEAATGMLVGMVAFVAFCAAMARVASRTRWPAALAIGMGAYAAVELSLFQWRPSLPWAVLACLAAVALGIAATKAPRGRVPDSPHPWWDIPLRMAVATALVFLLTSLAASLGPVAVGLLSPFPVFVSVLAGFTHRHAGGEAAALLLRGVLLGAFSFAVFFLVVGTLLPAWGLPGTYGAAAVLACLTNAVAFLFLRRVPDDEA